MRQNNIINYVLCLSLILTLFGKDLKGQTYSEAPMVYWEDSVLTDMIYVKFKKHNVVELPQGQTKATGHAISPSYPEIRQVFSDYSSKRGIFLTELQLRKAVPEAQPADTLFIDPKSGQGRILPDLSRIYLILFPKPVNVDPLMAKLEKRPEVEYTHGPVQWVEMAVETPDDPFYVDGTQWYLDAIQAPLAWEITKGSSTIRIALIEASGVELDHEDLMVKIAGGDNNPSGILSAHGTAVAGFAGAATNNGIGVASLGWKITLLTYQPVPDDDERTVLAGKINDAVNAGARVINMSFRTVKNDENLEACPDPLPPGFNKGQINWDYPAVRDAVAAAIGSNVVVIAAAGNDASSGNVFIYPCYEVPFTVWPA
ncbi:MAG: S8 family serine peptidase, partial [candidate division Zixibacteria bacterium]|nr:S8 family serine peptidase [candidate division Zixibacteria bacterium]NIX57141.1 S8 family serine peptidase [candidate division Zixibacteria bacterium]